MKIIDAFPFFNEIEILKIRLSMLYDKVDTFVICESNITHSGIHKPYNFLEFKNELTLWSDKIVFLKYEPDTSNLDFSKKITFFNPKSAAWIVENSQRNFLSTFLTTQHPNDVAVVCDVDEIWNPSVAEIIRTEQSHVKAARLEMQFHYYHLNCIGIGQNNSKWTHPFFAKVSYIKSNQDLTQIRVKTRRLPVIKNAGWHFSYIGNANKVSEKINAFSHQETNTPEINNLQHLARCISLGIDHLNRPDHEFAFRPIDYYPEVLRKEMKKYPHLIKSSLI